MIEILRKRRNHNELGQIHKAFVDRFEGLLADMEADGGRPRLQDTWRSIAAQRAKQKAGLSQITARGPHTNELVIGGHVVRASLATHFLNDDAPLAPGVDWIARLAVRAHRRGLQTGCAWAQSDSSSLARGMPRRISIEAAIVAGDEELVARLLEAGVGFDPLHVEVVGWRRFYGVNT
jgi:hypothetical protein